MSDKEENGQEEKKASETENTAESTEEKDNTPGAFPDLKEIAGMAGKFFGDLKNSVSEIINEYKAKRPKSEAAPSSRESEEANDKAEDKKDEDKG